MDAMCDPEDRIASDTGLSEQALRQLMREAFLLEMEQKRRTLPTGIALFGCGFWRSLRP
jgi:hypothetical protein